MVTPNSISIIRTRHQHRLMEQQMVNTLTNLAQALEAQNAETEHLQEAITITQLQQAPKPLSMIHHDHTILGKLGAQVYANFNEWAERRIHLTV